MVEITILSKTIKVNKPPDIQGFIQAMKDMGAKISIKEGVIVIDLHLGDLKGGRENASY